MGRYPFLEASNAYLEFVRPFVADLTAKERSRKLWMIGRTMADRGISMHPAKWGEREIGAFVAWMKESGFEPQYQAKLIQYVRGLLRFVGNPVLERMKGAKIVRLPLKAEKPVYAKDDAWYAETMTKLEGLSNWGAEAIRFATAFYYHTGLRVKELRLARLSDLDTARWTLTVEHPKGEGAWAAPGERIAIFPSVRPHVLDFLEARCRRLRDLGLEPSKVEALLPNERGAFFSEAGWRRRRAKTFAEAGIERANFRIMRPTFAQRLKDRGASIEAVSKALRHSSTATTERFYARIRTERAWDDLERVWETPIVRSILRD
jgi:integrase